MKLRSIILIAVALGWSSLATAQGIYFDPEPTDVTGPVRLYVDVSSSECDCPELLDTQKRIHFISGLGIQMVIVQI
jgi:hypothetical protein